MKRTSILLFIFFVTLCVQIVFLVNAFFAFSPIAAAPVQQTIPIVSSLWHISGNKELITKYQPITADVLKQADSIELTYNLHGLCLLPKHASEIAFESIASKKNSAVSLSNYGKNCYDGDQTVTIPLADFSGLPADTEQMRLKASFWYPTNYSIEIKSILASNTQSVLGAATRKNVFTFPDFFKRNIASLIHPTQVETKKPIPTATPTPTPIAIALPTPSPTPFATTAALLSQTHPSWSIQSVSAMKVTKDVICNQPDKAFIQQWVDKSVELGVNYVSIEQPYDSPSCGDAVAYTKMWVDVIRSRGLHIWHRHMPLAFEGIYDTAKNPDTDYLALIATYIKNNPSFFQAGDIFTPIPEPQNGGIAGVNYCSQNVCLFDGAAEFNQWLRDAMTTSGQAFQAIGLGGKIKIGYFGFDGFIAWGDNNPDWDGILEDATIAKMGNITIDHYPEVVGDTMENDLNELQVKYPNIPIVIGEWGTISSGDVEQQVQESMGAAVRKNVIGFNYWHLGPGGNEALIQDDFSNEIQFADVQGFYKSTK